ncbi:hypothetical protein [Opitutus sp. ER46]|uniref:hypothetical protein n=1 Tax=Opitutus sp. ER46 TaxID=2161864 RepID=UPI000D3081A3|nr:hypothetical protein [Opitutus sp. ER46]PTX90768.1 hypothetical protein DB354_19115 [Opitutus sp. ER46]
MSLLPASLALAALILPPAAATAASAPAEAPAAAISAPTPLTPAEAKEELRRAQNRASEPGSFRRVVSRKNKEGGATITTTTLTLRRTGQPTFTRTETVTVYDAQPDQPQKRIALTNEEGHWQILGNKAVLRPATAAPGVKSGDAAQKAKGSARPEVDQMKKFVEEATVSGERFTENGQPRLRVTRELGPEAQRFIKEKVDAELAKAKKELSFAKRVLVNTVLAAKGGIGAFLPVREVYVIDPARHAILTSKFYNSDGKQISEMEKQPEAQPNTEERIDELPLETFALPADVEVIRPATREEARELIRKLMAEEKKVRGAQAN